MKKACFYAVHNVMNAKRQRQMSEFFLCSKNASRWVGGGFWIFILLSPNLRFSGSIFLIYSLHTCTALFVSWPIIHIFCHFNMQKRWSFFSEFLHNKDLCTSNKTTRNFSWAYFCFFYLPIFLQFYAFFLQFQFF